MHHKAMVSEEDVRAAIDLAPCQICVNTIRQARGVKQSIKKMVGEESYAQMPAIVVIKRDDCPLGEISPLKLKKKNPGQN